MKIGDPVRLVQTRKYVKKSEAGRLMTVRGIGPDAYSDFAIRVDDGDPTNPDMDTNGFSLSLWLPRRAVEPVRRTE